MLPPQQPLTPSLPYEQYCQDEDQSNAMEDAVWSTLEMELFLTPQSASAAGISQMTEETTEIVAATSANEDAMKLILERMERMETELKNTRQHPEVGSYGSPVVAVFPSSNRASNQSQGWWRGRASRANYGNCWNCGGEGHLARACPSPRKPRPQQGNGPPPAISRAAEAGQQAHVSTIIPTISVTTGKDCVIDGLVNGVSASVLIDTGAALSILNKAMWDKTGGKGSDLKRPAGRKLVSIQGKPLQLFGTTNIQVELASEKFPG